MSSANLVRLRKKFNVVDDEFEMIETLYGWLSLQGNLTSLLCPR
jgi:hypothetical protein